MNLEFYFTRLILSTKRLFCFLGDKTVTNSLKMWVYSHLGGIGKKDKENAIPLWKGRRTKWHH